MNSLKMALESIGGLLAYRFSLLPKWARASFWALILILLVGGFFTMVILGIIWIINLLGIEIIIISAIIIIAFVVALAGIWGDIPDAKHKNDE